MIDARTVLWLLNHHEKFEHNKNNNNISIESSNIISILFQKNLTYDSVQKKKQL